MDLQTSIATGLKDTLFVIVLLVSVVSFFLGVPFLLNEYAKYLLEIGF